VGRFAFPPDERRTAQQQATFIRQLMTRLPAVPGVVAASPSLGFPIVRGPASPVVIPGITPSEPQVSAFEMVGEDYFAAVASRSCADAG